MKITDYLKEVRAEMVHVSFPTTKQTALFTGVVIALSLAVAVYLGLIDYVLSIVAGKVLI